MRYNHIGGKKGAARIANVSTMFLATLMILAPIALGADHPFGATGSTYIGTYCDSEVAADLPAYLDVANGDSVTIYYNYTYTDARGSPSTIARHDFTQLIEYDDWGEGESHWHNTTYYRDSGSGGIQMTVNNVMEDTSIWVKWYANVTCNSGPSCSHYDSDEGLIYLN